MLSPPRPQPSRSPAIDILQASPLAALTWLRHAFSTRSGGVSTAYGRRGDLNLGLTPEDTPAAVQENRRRLIAAAAPGGRPPWPLITTRQLHSNRILTITQPAHNSNEPADGFITATPNIFLAILTADCVPVLVADSRQRVVGIFHAGWRGTAARIVEHGVAAMQSTYASRPEDLLAAIGPSIGPCCYTVGEEVRTTFHALFPYAADLFHSTRLDLWQSNRRQLLAAGVPALNITTLAQCTACTVSCGAPRFFSYRAENARTGRLMSLVGIRPSHPLP